LFALKHCFRYHWCTCATNYFGQLGNSLPKKLYDQARQGAGL